MKLLPKLLLAFASLALVPGVLELVACHVQGSLGPVKVRVAVMGESSVEGSPFDVHVSMPAMLLDHLRALDPFEDLYPRSTL
jgi:hypothetical protein